MAKRRYRRTVRPRRQTITGCFRADRSARLSRFRVATIIIALAWLVLLVLPSIQSEEPLTTRNVRHVITIALIVGLSRTLVQLPQGFADYWISTRDRFSHTNTMMFRGTFTPGSPVAMMVILLLGWALSRGVRLRHNAKGQVAAPVGKPHRVVCHLDDLLAERAMTSAALAEAGEPHRSTSTS